MSVKVGRYVFVRIRGRIVPIRKGIEVASKAVTELADEAKNLLSMKVKKIGAGVDFKVFAKTENPDFVLKFPKNTKGTSNKAFLKAYPETKDKLAVARTLGENLPNYGIPTIESKILRIGKGKDNRVLVQEFQKVDTPSQYLNKNSQHLRRESEKLLKEHGLNIDVHAGNVTDKGYIVDTGGNLLKSKVRLVKNSRTAEEILGIDNYYGANLKDFYNKSEQITETVAVESKSSAVLRKLNSLKKKGFRLKSDDGENFKLLNPEQRIERAEKSGIVFKKVNGKITPTRGKK